MITRKQMNGKMNETLTAGIEPISFISMILACNGGSTEPPRIAIIRPAAPNLASSPIPFRAIPYIVGNISDMHAETATRQYSPKIFCRKIVPNVKIPPKMARIISNFPALR